MVKTMKKRLVVMEVMEEGEINQVKMPLVEEVLRVLPEKVEVQEINTFFIE